MAGTFADSPANRWPVPAQLASQIAALGRSLGIESLALDADGQLALAIDAGVTVHISCPLQLLELMLRVRVGPLARHAGPELLTDLLRFNRLDVDPDGPMVGLNEEDPPQLILAQRVCWRRLQVSEFVSAVERFIATAEDLEAMRQEVGEPLAVQPAFALKG